MREKRDTTRLKTIIDKIRADIKAGGGFTSAQIDQLVRESRARRRHAQTVMSLEDIEMAITAKLLSDTPKLLGISAEATGWLKAAESSFEFWDNKDDAIYDRL